MSAHDRGMRILSLAPLMRGASAVSLATHFDTYQQDLRAAAAELGHDLRLVARAGVPGSDGVLPVLPANGGRKAEFADPAFVAALEALLEAERAERAGDPRPLVLVRFEGRLLEFRAFVDLAVRHPDVTFIWNLFAPTRQERPPTVSRRPAGLVRARRVLGDPTWGRGGTVRVPSNLVVLHDTPTRSLRARGLGLPFDGIWPLHSRLATLPVAGPDRPDARGPTDRPRILVPLAAWHADRGTRFEVSQVLRTLDRTLPEHLRPRWTIAGAAPEGSEHRRWMASLSARGADVHPEEASTEVYAARFRDSDAVWLPRRDLYALFSSGKALDALVAGTPIIAPAGTYGAVESARWHVAPATYVRTAEVVDLLVRAADILPVLRAELRARAAEIRTVHSPRHVVEVLVAHVRAARDRAGAPPREVTLAAEVDRAFPTEVPVRRAEVLREAIAVTRGAWSDRRAAGGRH